MIDPAPATVVGLASDTDRLGWWLSAIAARESGIAPQSIGWSVAGKAADLFAPAQSAAPAIDASGCDRFKLPEACPELLASILLHRDETRFALAYRLFWRLGREPHLLGNFADADVARAMLLERAVRRDRHKMRAFVRFRRVEVPDGAQSEERAGDHYVAWFEPAHHIVDENAPFFVRRFANMRWSILTPDRCAHWDGVVLRLTPGVTRASAPSGDAIEDVWRAYYRSIFNPARVSAKTMQREMPKKYWKNLPEAELIPELLRSAPKQAARMIAQPPSIPRMTRASKRSQDDAARALTPQPPATATAETLRQAVNACTRCPLAHSATQAVMGEGPTNARLMIVGEQPGDQEDLDGRPFVGPAGRLLDAALARAGIDRSAAYVTNAVKHFKFEIRGKRRLHQSPDAGEIEHCRWWLAHEIALVKPELIIALGATAAQSLLQRPVAVTRARGVVQPFGAAASLLITVHPSYLLRLQSEADKRREWQLFVDDLKLAQASLDNRGARPVASVAS